MENEEKKETPYLVILNREDVLGEFNKLEDAELFCYICALRGDKGDTIELYQGRSGYRVG